MAIDFFVKLLVNPEGCTEGVYDLAESNGVLVIFRSAASNPRTNR